MCRYETSLKILSLDTRESCFMLHVLELVDEELNELRVWD